MYILDMAVKIKSFGNMFGNGCKSTKRADKREDIYCENAGFYAKKFFLLDFQSNKS